MKLYYRHAVQGNFGDVLNEWLWPRLLPRMWDDDGTIFVGIGTIIDRDVPQARARVVFGSGAGYAPPPDVAATSGNWRIYGVRGPLTAHVLRLDPRLALTDSAILLGELEEFKMLQCGTTVFVPHWKSVRYGSWQAICNELDIEFIDPRTDSQEVVRRIAGAGKVIAESMHAAIIADAFRVPWIPIALSREISSFKWADWSLSKGLQYEPFCLPPSNAIEYFRDRLLRGSMFEGNLAYPSAAQLTGAHALRFSNLEDLIRDFEVICARLEQPWWMLSSRLTEAAFKRVAEVGRRREARNGRQFDRACRALSSLAAMPGTLSSQAAHDGALERTQTALERLKFDWANGFIGPVGR
jgi:succinoglycan biosynthesis protein ExoV